MSMVFLFSEIIPCLRLGPTPFLPTIDNLLKSALTSFLFLLGKPFLVCEPHFTSEVAYPAPTPPWTVLQNATSLIQMESGRKKRGNCTIPYSHWAGTRRLQFPVHQYQFLCPAGSCGSAHLIWVSHEVTMLFGAISCRRADLTCWATPSKHFEHLSASKESISSVSGILRPQWFWSMTMSPESGITISGKPRLTNACQQSKHPLFSLVRMGFILTDTLVQPYQTLQCLFI